MTWSGFSAILPFVEFGKRIFFFTELDFFIFYSALVCAAIHRDGVCVMEQSASLERDFEFLYSYLYGERVKACAELENAGERKRRGIVGKIHAFERREEALVRIMDALDMYREMCGEE